MTLSLKSLARDGAALAGGLLYPLAFAPFDAPWLLFPALMLLFSSWQGSGPARAAWRGALFGAGQFGLGVSWVYVSIHDFGGATPAEAAALTALFVLAMALYPAATGALTARIFSATSTPARVLIALPGMWTLSEWVRSGLFTGFPWLLAGASQMDFPLARLAPWGGVFAVSWAAATVAGVGVLLTFWRGGRRTLLLLGVIGCGLALRTVPPTPDVEPAAPPFHAALLQGNIPQDLKWRPDTQSLILERYLELTRAHFDQRLIVWPETAVPVFYHQAAELLTALGAEAHAHGAEILVGAPIEEDGQTRYYNGLIKVQDPPAVYRKRHLVPFGEFLPLRPLFGWILALMEIPLGDFNAGDRDQPLLTGAGFPLAASICYEDTFGNEARMDLPEAAYLVNVSNDAWFGDSIAPHQHLQMARMRALEAGRWMLRATNTGLTAIIDPQGRVVSRLPAFQTGALVGEITPMRGATPYVRWGDGPVIGLLLTLLAACALAARRISR